MVVAIGSLSHFQDLDVAEAFANRPENGRAFRARIVEADAHPDTDTPWLPVVKGQALGRPAVAARSPQDGKWYVSVRTAAGPVDIAVRKSRPQAEKVAARYGRFTVEPHQDCTH